MFHVSCFKLFQVSGCFKLFQPARLGQAGFQVVSSFRLFYVLFFPASLKFFCRIKKQADFGNRYILGHAHDTGFEKGQYIDNVSLLAHHFGYILIRQGRFVPAAPHKMDLSLCQVLLHLFLRKLFFGL